MGTVFPRACVMEEARRGCSDARFCPDVRTLISSNNIWGGYIINILIYHNVGWCRGFILLLLLLGTVR